MALEFGVEISEEAARKRHPEGVRSGVHARFFTLCSSAKHSKILFFLRRLAVGATDVRMNFGGFMCVGKNKKGAAIAAPKRRAGNHALASAEG